MSRPLSLSALVLRYAGFAVIAVLVNLGVQRLVLGLGAGLFWFLAAMGAGTLAGLVVKYLLDKRWIFADRSSGLKDHTARFSLYTAMGLVTTAIFWGTETAFWLIWQTDLMRETGAVIGLTIGYWVKYRLDRRFVFTDAPVAAGGSPGCIPTDEAAGGGITGGETASGGSPQDGSGQEGQTGDRATGDRPIGDRAPQDGSPQDWRPKERHPKDWGSKNRASKDCAAQNGPERTGPERTGTEGTGTRQTGAGQTKTEKTSAGQTSVRQASVRQASVRRGDV